MDITGKSYSDRYYDSIFHEEYYFDKSYTPIAHSRLDQTTDDASSETATDPTADSNDHNRRSMGTGDGSTKENRVKGPDLLRRSRNKEHARRSRQRKKNMLDMMKDAVVELAKQNSILRDALTVEEKGFPNRGRPSEYFESNLTTDRSNLVFNDDTIHTFDHPGFNFIKALQSQKNFVIIDGSEPDPHIIFANHGFLSQTNLSPDDIIGKSCSDLRNIKFRFIEYV